MVDAGVKISDLQEAEAFVRYVAASGQPTSLPDATYLPEHARERAQTGVRRNRASATGTHATRTKPLRQIGPPTEIETWNESWA